jgi:7-cyano-7-deazaguanine synthase
MNAVILLSGGIDSTVVLALALEKKRRCMAISFDYGQRHRIELNHASKIASHYGLGHKLIKIDPTTFSKSSLVDKNLHVPKGRSVAEMSLSGIPNTYVPARNTLFLAFATAIAEIEEAQEIYAGPNLLDQNPYPDCRPIFYKAFQEVINTGTKQATEGKAPVLITPLIHMDKKAIVNEGRRLKVPFEETFSCYDPAANGEACKQCDACHLREIAFL